MPKTRINRMLSVLLALLFSAMFFSACNLPTDGTDGKKDGDGTEQTNQLPGTYKILFDTGVESIEVSPIIKLPGETVLAPITPVRGGYRFEGWLLDGEPYDFEVMPGQNITLTAKWVVASKLPALNIALHQDNGATLALSSVTREKYVKSTIGFGENGKTEFAAEFKGRGNGSWGGSKKPYRIKFEKKQAFFGWPKSKHYTLISSTHNFSDNSMMVADSAFSLARSVLTNLEYAPRTQAVDVYVNGAYQGVYIMADKIRVEEDKVDILSEHGINDTGYLLLYANSSHSNDDPGFARFSVDGDFRRSPPGVNQSGAGANGFRVKSPDPDDVADPLMPEVTQSKYTQQVSYIKSETNKLTNSMKALNFAQFANLADVASFVDGYIIQELYRNTDVGEGGYYLYKKATSEGGKFYAGPPWDFDRTMSGTGLGIANGEHQANPFCTYLCAMPEFKALVKARWQEISPSVTEFLTVKFDYYIDDPAYQASFARNWVRWDNKNQEQAEKDWIRNATGKKNWLLDRADYLNDAWGGW